MELITALQELPWLTNIVVLVVGLLVGSFLNVVIHRLPIMMEREWKTQCAELNDHPAPEFEHLGLVTPRSRCPACGHQITALENIPIISYLVLGGKCSACKTKISTRYPLVELVTGLASGYLAYRFGFGWPLLAVLTFTWMLIAMSMIDIDTTLLPDSLTLPLLWLGLVLSLDNMFVSPKDAILGAAFGYLSLWSVYHLFKLVTGKEGMGYGDFKLLAALGAWVGWQQLPLVILLSALVGAIVGIGLMVLKSRGKDVPIPFGPYLAAAGWIALLWGEEISGAYLGLWGL